MENVSAEWLGSIENLKDVPSEQLQWMIDNSTISETSDGDFIFRSGEPMTGTLVLLEGRIKMYMLQNNEIRDLLYIEKEHIFGYLPFSRGLIFKGMVQAIGNVRIMTLPMDKIREMINKHFELTQALVHIMTNRVRNFTAYQQQNEKMMALGKLSAGLAHELNNPAAAIVRGSSSLIQHLQLEPTSFKEVMAIRMEEKEVDIVTKKLFEILNRGERPKLTLIQRTEKEDAVRDWLDDHQVANSGEVAENFVDYAFTCEDMESFKEHIPKRYLSPVFNWINTNLVTERMVMDIQKSSQRISDLVKSIKSFTHMDQGKGKEYTDIHEGLRNTLIILQHKIKKENVTVTEQYDETLPKVKAMVGELNQVWTNLIDNALDAMEVNGKGQLTIRTRRDREFVEVTITDDGPGIPDEIRSQIFDPFFTTKDIGKGTGLGLDVVMRIVQQHRGSVKVSSRPGRTDFIVCFLIDG
ncbi:MAG TPA: ATP-binding protein [Puia sp.]|nr:ATP-binding protein [Puia sp.]